MKKVIAFTLALTMAALAAGCTVQTEAPAEEITETTTTTVATTVETEAEIVTTPEAATSIKVIQQADKIAMEYMAELKKNVQDVNYDAFVAMFDTNTCSEEFILAKWNAYYDYFCGENVYEVECKTTAFSDTEIVFDNLFYWETYDNAYTNWSSDYKWSYNLCIVYDNASQKWVFSSKNFDDDIMAQINAVKINSYGEKAYTTGYCSGDYRLLHDSAPAATIEAIPKSAYLNEDGSLNLVVGIINGCGVNKNLTKNTLDIKFGSDSDNMKNVVILSGNEYPELLGSVQANSIKYVEINVPREKLLSEITNQDFGRCSCSNSWLSN